MTMRREILGWLLGLVFGARPLASATVLIATGKSNGGSKPSKENLREMVKEWLKHTDAQLQIAIEEGRGFQLKWEAGEVVGFGTHGDKKYECGMLDGRHDFKIHIDRKSDEDLLKAWNGPSLVPRDSIAGTGKMNLSMTSNETI